MIDGGSDDGSRELAAKAGARVVEQSGTGGGSGKGQAVREAIERHVQQPYVLMLDGDATYRPEQADRLLDPLLRGEAEHVVGDRFADMESGAMTRLNRIGNSIINSAFSTIHGRYLSDILSGYRAFTLASARRLNLTADGFGIETEMSVECVKHGITTTVVPITYRARPDDSETSLNPFRDGAVIILTLYRMAKTNNPLFYFGSVGVASLFTGLCMAIYVGYEWFFVGVSHEVIAVGAASGLLFGVQLLMFGVLSDMIVALNREQTRQLGNIARQLSDDTANLEGQTDGADSEQKDGSAREPDGEPASSRSQ